MKYSTSAHIDKLGNLKMSNKETFIKFATSLNCKEFTISIEKRRSKRSNEQNKYYWGVVVSLMMQGLIDIGYVMDEETTHDFIKTEFNYKILVNEETGETKKIPISTSNLTKTEFSEMIEKIKIFASEWLGVYIPDPNEQTVIDY